MNKYLPLLLALSLAPICWCCTDEAFPPLDSGPPGDTRPSPDRPAPDRTRLDLPRPDWAKSDRAVPDLLVPDLPIPDLPLPDLPLPDLPLPDLSIPDQLVPDLAVPDLAVPDAMVVIPNKALCTSEWCWEIPLPHGNTIKAVRGIGGTVYTVGGAGAVSYRTAAGPWESVYAGTDERLNAVWGSSSSDIWVAGDKATLAHFDGKIWKHHSGLLPALHKFTGLWGSGPNDVYLTSAYSFYGNGHLFHWDGKKWSDLKPSGLSGLSNFGDVWGTGPGDVTAASSGASWHFDGKTWSSSWVVASGSTPKVGRLWGDGQVLWAGTEEYDDVLYRWSGGGYWKVYKTGTQVSTLRAVWGSGPKDIWAAGNSGQVIQYNGSKWVVHQVTPKGNFYLYDIYRASATAPVYTVGAYGTVYRRGGGTWTMDRGTPASISSTASLEVDALWANSVTDVWALHRQGFLHFDGKKWSPTGPKITNPFIHGRLWGYGTQIWALLPKTYSTPAEIVHFDGQKWLPAVAAPSTLNDIWGAGPKQIVGVGESGEIHLWNGGSWTKQSSGTKEGLDRVCGTSTTDMFAIGDNGTVLRFDGKGWKKMTGFTKSDQLMAIWCHSPSFAVIVGYHATWRWDGKSWTKDVMPGQYDYLMSVWGSGPTDVYAGSQFGLIAHWDGKAWSQSPSGFDFNVKAMHGMDAKNIWAGGVGGVIRRK